MWDSCDWRGFDRLELCVHSNPFREGSAITRVPGENEMALPSRYLFPFQSSSGRDFLASGFSPFGMAESLSWKTGRIGFPWLFFS